MNNLIDGRPVFLVKRFRDLRIALNIRIFEFERKENTLKNSQIISTLKWVEGVFVDLLLLLDQLFKLLDFASRKIGGLYAEYH